MTSQINKYPRTQHIEGSRLQEGDHDLSQVRFETLEGRHLVVEEKVDGANAGISFDGEGQMLLQSRGHFLMGGPRERHWTLFKQWAAVHEDTLFDILSDRYIMYGEWMYAKHTVFYDFLPHYFMEFDIYDREEEIFLSTPRRREMLFRSPVRSVLVLHEGQVPDFTTLRILVRKSYFKTGNWVHNLAAQAERVGVDPVAAGRQTDACADMEGLYIKVEDDEHVSDRLKWIRHTFTSSIMDSGTHWLDRTIVPNLLAPGVDIFRR